MQLFFTKMHGLGNDFVVINSCLGSENLEQNTAFKLTRQQIIKIADRHFGIGCDQVLLIENSSLKQIDFKYRIFNGDGTEVQQCGNGARCFALYVHEKGLCDKTMLAVETLSGIIYLYLEAIEKKQDLTDQEVSVRVDMGQPNFQPQSLPFIVSDAVAIKKNQYQLKLVDDSSQTSQTVCFSAVSMGNPHITLLIKDVEKYDVSSVGARLLKQAIFPQGVNVGFMQVIDESHIRLRVYERGTGETLACGSGACAAVVNGIQQGVLKHQVKVQLHSGYLIIKWTGDISQSVWMSGPASFVFEGQIEI